MSKKPKGAGGTPKNITNPYLRILISAAYGILFDLILLLLFSLLLSSRDMPAGMTVPITTLILVGGAMLGGFLCGKALRKNGLLNGLLIGGLQFLLMLLISLALPGNEVGILALYKLLILAVSAGIGSILGVNHRKKMKKSALGKKR